MTINVNSDIWYVAAAMGIFVLTGAYLLFSAIRRIVKCTESTTATVTQAERLPEKFKSKRDSVYTITYSYKDSTGTEYSYTPSAKSSRCKVRVGDEVIIKYNPDNPNMSSVSETGTIIGSCLFIMLGFISFIVYCMNAGIL